MKNYIITCLLLITGSIAFGQAKFQKNQEVTVFDGYEWIDSKIIDINDKGQYLVYVDKKMTKTKWVGAEDIEAYATDNSEDVVIIKVNITESQEVPIFKVGDKVKYKSGDTWIDSEIATLGANETVMVYTNVEKTETISKEEKDVIITFSISQPEYRTKTVKKTIHYNLNEEVQYLSNNQWITGVISKMNDSNQVFIDGKWHEIDVVRKK
jgi:hypothetical protein